MLNYMSKILFKKIKYLNLSQLDGKFDDKKFHYIFGLNGTGKTTLSRNIDADNKFSKKFIFNKDYINKNIYIEALNSKNNQAHSKVNAKNMTNIFLGETNIDLNNKFNNLQTKKTNLKTQEKTLDDTKTKIKYSILESLRSKIPLALQFIQLNDIQIQSLCINYKKKNNELSANINDEIIKWKKTLRSFINKDEINNEINSINDKFQKINFNEKIQNKFQKLYEIEQDMLNEKQLNSFKLHSKAQEIYKNENHFYFLNNKFSVQDLEDYLKKINNEKNQLVKEIISYINKNKLLISSIKKSKLYLKNNINVLNEKLESFIICNSEELFDYFSPFDDKKYKSFFEKTFKNILNIYTKFDLITDEQINEKKLKLKTEIIEKIYYFLDFNAKKLLSSYISQKKPFEQFKQEITKEEQDLNQEIQDKQEKFKEQIKNVKFFLKQLQFEYLNEQINIQSENRKWNLQINFTGMNTLSEGEKKAICFSLFLTDIYLNLIIKNKEITENENILILIDDAFDSNDYKICNKINEITFLNSDKEEKKFMSFYRDNLKKLKYIYLTHNIIIFTELIRNILSNRSSLNGKFKYFYNFKNNIIDSNIFTLNRNQKTLQLVNLNEPESIYFFNWVKISTEFQEIIFNDNFDPFKNSNNATKVLILFFLVMSLNNFNNVQRNIIKSIISSISTKFIPSNLKNGKNLEKEINKDKEQYKKFWNNLIDHTKQMQCKNSNINHEIISFNNFDFFNNLSKDEQKIFNNCFNDLWKKIIQYINNKDEKSLKNLRHNNLAMNNTWSYMLY